MFRQLVIFEWVYHTRQISFLLSALLAFAVGVQIGGNLVVGPQVFLNSASNVNNVAVLLSLASIFVLMVTCANAMLRDSDHKMSELVFATSISKWTLLSSRFTGALAAAFTVMAIAMLGAFVSVFMPWVDAEMVGPVNPWYHLFSLLVLILPSMFFSGAIIFAIAALSRNMIATYLGAAGIYVLYIVISAAGGSPMFANNTPPSPAAFAMAAKFDPFAITTYLQQVEYWSPAQHNGQLMQLESHFLQNRLLVIGVGLLILLGLHQVFRLQMPKQKQPKAKAQKPQSTQQYHYKVVAPIRGWLAAKAAWVSSLKLEMGLILKSKPFIGMIVLWSALILMELVNSIANLGFGPKSYPTTTLLLSAFQFDTLPRFGAIFIIYYSAEIFWRDRNVNFNAFIDSMPVTNPVLFSTKFLALLMVPFTMITASIVVSMGLQLVKGYSPFEPLLYLSVFVYAGLPLVCVAVLALLIQSMSKNKYIGMVLTAFVMLATGPMATATLGLDHPMFNFSRVPVLNYTDMNGYAASSDGFAWYMLYWGALTVLFAVISFVVWPRGTEFGFRHRFKQVKHFPNAKLAMTACVVVLLCSGSYIFYQTNVVNEYLTRSESQQRRADYEKAFKQYHDMAQPRATAIKIDAQLYPEQRRYVINGEYVLTNKTQQPINRLLISNTWDDIDVEVKVKSAKAGEYNHYLKTQWFDLNNPLLPGQSVTMDVVLKSQQSGFEGTSFVDNMIQNGAYVMLNVIAPRLGYRGGRQLSSTKVREKYQLGAKAESETLEQAIERTGGDFSQEYEWIDYEATVSTAIDQTVITQGALVKQWQESNRQYFHYKSKRPQRNVVSFISGRYESKKEQHGDVSIEVYYHETHGKNVDHMIMTIKDTLDYFSANFSAYQYDHLRITEVPASRGMRQTGFASSGNIMLTNHGGLLSDLNSNYDVDQLYRRVAHEMAHQWWGHQLDPALIQGNLVMIETLAKYSEMRVIEKRFGKAMARDLAAFESRRYLRGRATEPEAEMPLYKAERNHLLYSKGSYVMYELVHLLGEKTMNGVMVKLLSDFAYPKKPPTSLDFLDLLYAGAPASTHDKINELMQQRVIYDLAIEDATVTELENGRYQVDVEVKSRKNTFSGLGEASPMKMDEAIEIGIFNQFPTGEQIETGALMLQAQVLKGSTGQYSFIVDQKPTYVVIDPNYYRIDNNRADNLKRL